MRARHLLVALALGIIGINLAWVLWLGVTGEGIDRLADVALERVPQSGVSNPITSVLLNFRAYDTLLELAVLLAAILGIWSSGPALTRFLPGGPVLRSLTTSVVPLLILAAGYMLWVGGHAPGGAFQAGALLGAAGVMLSLAGQANAGLPSPRVLRGAIVLGVLVFTMSAVVLMGTGAGFLTFPIPIAKWLILFIETAATLTIGATLAAAYLAGEPPAPERFSHQRGGSER